MVLEQPPDRGTGISLAIMRSVLPQGELQLDIRLRGGPVEITKHWVVYAGTGIIREWLTIDNVSDKEVKLKNLFFLNTRILGGVTTEKMDMELAYMTGGGNLQRQSVAENRAAEPQLYSDIRFQCRCPDRELQCISAFASDSRSALQRHHGDRLGLSWATGRFRWVTRQASRWAWRSRWRVTTAALSPGGQVITPKAFTAALSGDLDAIGNQILEWQYRYFWDLTNPEYFGKTRWAVDWPDPWVGDGGTLCADNWGRRLSLDLRYVDLMREAGGDILWDDAGWYDRWGDWNGPDWRLTTSFLRKHDMRWVLWQPTFLATAESKVAQEHPDWLIRGQMVLEQSIAATAAWQNDLLDKEVAAWGDFQTRYDIAPAASANDTKQLAADQNFRDVSERFKKSHPGKWRGRVRRRRPLDQLRYCPPVGVRRVYGRRRWAI